MKDQEHLFKVYIRMSDGQVFEKEFKTYSAAAGYIWDIKALKTMFCIRGDAFESETWINPKQIVSAEVMRVL